MQLNQLLDLAAAVAVGGPAVTILTQAVKRAQWSDARKLLTAVTISILVGAAEAWLSGRLLPITSAGSHVSGAVILEAACAVFAGATAFYHLHFKNTAWAQRLERQITTH